MSKQLLVLEEILAMMAVVEIPPRLIDRFRTQAEEVLKAKPRYGPNDAITVSSGFGRKSQQGFVDLTLNDQRSQMEPAKAREIGLMLIQAAEAAVSDHAVVLLLKEIGVTDEHTVGQVLLDLREQRQGTRDVAWPT